MSLREEQTEQDRQKNCGRGLGLAVAAVGVGVGAALYYWFSQRQDTPEAASSTGNYDAAQALSRSGASSQRFRERAWSLEECSICFDVMLNDQRLTTLPCTHQFHEACVATWLEDRVTCPNCRKSAI